MSKYTEAEEHLIVFLTECSMWCKENHLTETFKRAIKALQIADRLKQADAEEAKNIYCQELSCAGLCDECDHLEDFADGYNQALADIRGDAE